MTFARLRYSCSDSCTIPNFDVEYAKNSRQLSWADKSFDKGRAKHMIWRDKRSLLQIHPMEISGPIVIYSAGEHITYR